MFYVYAHFERDTGRLFYIGKGSKRRAWDKFSRNKHWKNIAEKHGVEVAIISKDLTEEEAFAFESAIIMDYEEGELATYTSGGPGISGYRHTDKAKEKMSLARIGKPMSELTKENMSISIRSNGKEMLKRKNKFLSEDNPAKAHKNRLLSKTRMTLNNPMKNLITKQKMIISNTGRKVSSETVEKIRNKLIGRKNGPMHENTVKALSKVREKRKRPVITSCGLSFSSTLEAQKITGVRQGNIVNNCSGRTNSAGGYHWMYKNELA